jgi:hypothetical protein
LEKEKELRMPKKEDVWVIFIEDRSRDFSNDSKVFSDEQNFIKYASKEYGNNFENSDDSEEFELLLLDGDYIGAANLWNDEFSNAEQMSIQFSEGKLN